MRNTVAPEWDFLDRKFDFKDLRLFSLVCVAERTYQAVVGTAPFKKNASGSSSR